MLKPSKVISIFKSGNSKKELPLFIYHPFDDYI